MESIQLQWQQITSFLFSNNLAEFSAASLTAFVLITAAEIGDKSQLVCMTLAARHRAFPIILGAVSAFALLNTLAVVFGAVIARWLPEYLVAASVAILFALFGVHALGSNEEGSESDTPVKEKSGHGIFFTTFLLITVAEFGDKTQLAVAGLSSTALPAAVWLGSTLALTATSALGVLAGRTILKKIPLSTLHKLSGFIFIALSLIAAYKALISLSDSINFLPLILQKIKDFNNCF